MGNHMGRRPQDAGQAWKTCSREPASLAGMAGAGMAVVRDGGFRRAVSHIHPSRGPRAAHLGRQTIQEIFEELQAVSATFLGVELNADHILMLNGGRDSSVTIGVTCDQVFRSLRSNSRVHMIQRVRDDGLLAKVVGSRPHLG